MVGMAVWDTLRKGLTTLNSKIFALLEQFPENTARSENNTEQITTEKLRRVKVESGVKKLKAVLQGGEVEEMLLQTEIKLSLAGKMSQWKPGEPLVEEPPADKWKYPI